MSQLPYSDLIDTPVPLSPAEVVALVLGVADALADADVSSLPPDRDILLHSTGHVTLARVISSDEGCKGDDVHAAQLASLMRRLLQLDKPGVRDRRRRVSAPLLVLITRALGQTDTPQPSLAEFRQALEHVATPDATTLAAVFWRAARLRVPPRPYSVTLPAMKMESALTARSADDRRQNAPDASQLRRYLRETERELFEARALHPEPMQASPLSTPGEGRRAGTRLAATVAGAVLGTSLAFVLAGTASRVPDRLSSHQPVAMARVEPASTARAERPIHTSRTVQPLLLSAAVGSDVFSPSYGPRGHALLFHAGRKSAPLMRASVTDDGAVDHIETLLDDGASNYHVTMSPDGTRIAYDSDREGARGVYVAHADGSAPQRISGAGYAAVPSWAPDGDRVAFVRAEPGHPRVLNVWIHDLHSGRLQRVTNHTVGQPWGASWFPDGRRLAFSLEDRLMVADLESGLARGYRSPRAGRLVRTPAVSPDGRMIVFQVQRDGVWLLDVERARMRRILEDATAEEFVWSPSGDAIAYHARTGGSYGLWRLALNTSGN